MKTEARKRKSLRRESKAAQTRHAQLLDKVAKTQAKLEKRQRKLQDLEATMIQLERSYATAHREQPDSSAPADGRTVRMIFNPNARKTKHGTYPLETIVARLGAHGIRAEVEIKTSKKAARALAKEAVTSSAHMVIVAGGDSSVEEVAAELIGSETILGIIPSGTMNNLARVLGIPLELDDACALLATGTARYIDVGRISAREQPESTYFVETAGVGLSALIAPAGQNVHKQRWGALPQALRAFLEFKAAVLTVTCDDDEPLITDTQVVTISNSPLIGPHTPIAPDARVDDGLLDVALYDGLGKMELIGYFLDIFAGRAVERQRATFHRARHIRIVSDRPLEASADLRVLPASKEWEIEVIPHALKVIVGNGSALILPAARAATARPEEVGQPVGAS
jgi:diacylglycerol kinase (ATP)